MCLALATQSLMSVSISASTYSYDKEEIISNVFSIRPDFTIIEDGEEVISNVFSIRPDFTTFKQEYFYSNAFRIVDMPPIVLEADGEPIEKDTLITKETEFTVESDFKEFTFKDDVVKVEAFVKESKTGEEQTKVEVEVTDYAFDAVVPAELEKDTIYTINCIIELSDGFKYRAESIEFYLNIDGRIVFLSPEGYMLFKEFVEVEYLVASDVPVKKYNLYLEELNGTRHLVGKELSYEDTLIEVKDGYSIHKSEYKLPEGIDRYKHVIEVVE